MEVNNIKSASINETAQEVDYSHYQSTYDNLNSIWNKYKDDKNLTTELTKTINDDLTELNKVINPGEGESTTKTEEQVQALINRLTKLIKGEENGNKIMLSIEERVNCLKNLSIFNSEPNNKDLTSDNYTSLQNYLNNVDSTYTNSLAFYKDLYSNILDKYSYRLDDTTKTELQTWINNITKEDSVDTFYSVFITSVLQSKEENLKAKDYKSLKGTNYNNLLTFFNALSEKLMNYTMYEVERETNISGLQTNLKNKTLSMQVMQASNAYKLLEIDNYMSEKMNKRAEMDPAMKRLRDGNYLGDNMGINHPETIKKEEELWTKKQE